MHALIVGERGVGKSTLINRVLEALDRPVCGFVTKKEEESAVPGLGSPVYIYEVGQPYVRGEENLIGYSAEGRPEVCKSAFEAFAPKLRRPAPENGVILMDELGFMESAAESFCAAVLSVLDGHTPVIAAVKNRDIPFLKAVRSHPKCRCFSLTEENRDELYGQVLNFLLKNLK